MEPAPGNLGTSSEDVTIKSRAPLTLPSHLPLLRATSDLQAASLLPLEKPERRAVPRAPKAQPGGQWERQGSSDAVGRAWCPGELRPGRPCKLQHGSGLPGESAPGVLARHTAATQGAWPGPLLSTTLGRDQSCPRGPLPGLLSSGDQPLPGWLSGRCPRGLSFFWAPLGLKVRKLPFSKELGASGKLKQEKEINVPCLASRGPGPCPWEEEPNYSAESFVQQSRAFFKATAFRLGGRIMQIQRSVFQLQGLLPTHRSGPGKVLVFPHRRACGWLHLLTAAGFIPGTARTSLHTCRGRETLSGAGAGL